ncbi:hypothetical protein [Pseudonocardia acaciae]|uniref:hypothetical protein n=1 Tax=Pseudonocardia acaciae TaxID=551276 RepID=UPI0004912A17|nr:hypothetical protein [Pseudonocardia acaciae]
MTSTTNPPPNTSTNAEVADAFRRLADLVDDVELPAVCLYFCLWCPDTRAELAALARAALRRGARVDKEPAGEQVFRLVLRIGPLSVGALAARDAVCERVVVATREVTELVPDPEAPAPPMVERTRTEELVEWVCPPILAGGVA